MREASALRVAFLAASLRRGGAEKQFWYQATALRSAGVDLRVFTLTRGEHYEGRLREAGIEPDWIGRRASRLARLGALAARTRAFRPHVVQSTHAFGNLYAAGAARASGAVSLGALRGSVRRCERANGIWTRWLLSAPTALVVNSRRSAEEIAERRLLPERRVFLLENAIDVREYAGGEPSTGTAVRVALVGSLARVKRADVFLQALARARASREGVTAAIVGDGPEAAALRELAERLDLREAVAFLGERPDVPDLLRKSDLLVLCSDDEGVPNAVLEAMAAGLPVVATPAGDTAAIVQDGVTGFVVPLGDAAAIADRIVRLADDPALRRRLGEAGRDRVARLYGLDGLADRLLDIYRAAARRQPSAAVVGARRSFGGGSH